MKVVLINGSPHEAGCTYTALSTVAEALESESIETEIFQIGNGPIQGCVDCRKCKDGRGRCAFTGDAVNVALEKVAASDGLVVGSPVYYSAPSGPLVSLLNRMFYAGNCFSHKPGAALVSARRAGATATFEQLCQYFSISNMPIVSSQYWNMVYGSTPSEIRQDSEGLQIMRTLGKNMAWLLECIAAGKRAGIPAPGIENRTRGHVHW